MIQRIACAAGACAVFAAAGLVLASSVGGIGVSSYTIDGGGGTSSGGGYELSGTIGQPDATAAYAMTGGDYQLTGGFWAVTLPFCNTFVAPDFDQDCDVDMADYDRIAACTLGANVPYDPQSLPPGCTFAPDGGLIAPDFDGDGDVDPDDFGTFQRCVSGADLPAIPGCDG